MPYRLGTATSVAAITVQTTTPPSSGDRPRRAKAPTTPASIGSRIIAAEVGPGAATAAINDDNAPSHGPNRIAIGSVATRPKSSGAADPIRHRLRNNPAAPHATARPRRRREMRFMECDARGTGRPRTLYTFGRYAGPHC